MQVLHSQRPKETALQPWLILKKDGTVESAHCNCMAGLGESCTHVAATLFAIEAAVKVRDSKTVTETKSYWLPASVKGVSYSTINNIDFISAKSKKRNLDLQLQGSPVPQRGYTDKIVPKPSVDDISSFLKNLSVAGANSAILTVVSPYSDRFIPQPLHTKFPQVLHELADETTFSMNYGELLDHCNRVEITLKQEECDAVEAATQDQASCKLWHRFRSGRITASRMKSVCHSKPSVPSRSLINAICHPGDTRIKTAATDWGCTHEKTALETYRDAMCMLHDNFQVKDVGLVLNPKYPVFGASPDALCVCDCCGNGVVEIKCPYCVRSTNLDEQSNSCLQQNDDGTKSLMEKHQYFYQVQTQIFICEKEYCDFVVWTEKEVHIERIEPHTELWNSISDKAKTFHQMAIMPELIGKFFSHPSPLSQNPEKKTSQPTTVNVVKLYCICRKPETDNMVACDNENCALEWFHYQCMKVTAKTLPKGKWYCHDCAKLPQFQKKKAKSQKKS